MLENTGRKITLIALLLAVAVACMLLRQPPFRLGLDLQGGTRLVYRFDFDKAEADGKITAEERLNPAQMMQNFVAIIRERVDPQGVLEPIIRAEGDDRVVIELPGTAELASASAEGPLESLLSVDDKSQITLAGVAPEELRKFPVTGGVVLVDGEKIRYEERLGPELLQLDRGYQNTQVGEHQAQSIVHLVGDDAIRNAIESTGEMRFYLGATTTDFNRAGAEAGAESERVKLWMTENPGESLTRYNVLSREAGGPPAGIHYFLNRQPSGEEPLPDEARLGALKDLPGDYEFTGDNVDQVRLSQDQLGLNAVFFKMKANKRLSFGKFTREHIDQGMGIVINEQIATLATIQAELPGEGIITGGSKGFTLTEVNELITVLRSGSLRIKPELEAEERVGASLGDEYVSRGFTSALLGLALVLGFVMIYFRRLGVIAAISLCCNLTMLMGALAFLQATLTLPGIAGIILTVGMAVDANILIFERIREESERGSKLLQASQTGFDKALSTIVDANLTTLITAIVLYSLGTGPVRGFATTLIIGILTSMFAALMITRVLVHLSVESGVKKFNMSRIIGNTDFKFLQKARIALPISLLLIVAGVTMFVRLPDRDKLGIDFTGGFSVTTVLEEPASVESIRKLIRTIPGTVGESEVKPILDSGSKTDGFTRFRVTGKMALAGRGEVVSEGEELTGESEIRKVLGGRLSRGPVDIEVDENTNRVSGKLYFEESHTADDVRAAVGTTGLVDPIVEAVAGRQGQFTFSATANTAPLADIWRTRMTVLFKDREDSSGTAFRFSSPIPESSIVGPQVVGELRDKAVLAILISLFAVVLYVRFRFAEYSYGLAAVAALVHDVLITLGCLAVAIWSDFIEAEISLPMIAAFLTIIGYSLNDTIVVFDRIRENMPRMKGNLREVLNKSINQTLSRTLLTSITTLLAVLVLLSFNLGSRNVLEGFAFALAIGVLVGTYSSVFVACPVLLWLERRAQRAAPAEDASITPAA